MEVKSNSRKLNLERPSSCFLSREREMADLICLELDLGSDSGVKLSFTNEESKVDYPAECQGPSLLVGKGE